jgi:rhamnogalacturonyl hydrolase YesR
MRHYLLLVISVYLIALALPAAGLDSTARVIPLDNSAWSGSSVNVMANIRQSVYTDSVHQYAGYYNADGRMVLAKRRLGDDHWQTVPTPYKGNVVDAHNHISLVIDGEGYLHVAWNHHNSPLNYARSLKPGGLELGSTQNMARKNEGSVTYPQFYRLTNGDLLFQYRDGGSGNGRLVVNYYSMAKKSWRRLHKSLIDGEGKRSAYWDMAIDVQGVLHLAWIWRETPDVASNHDIAYAQSKDDGKTWTAVDGRHYKLPITAATAQYVISVPQNHNLMNPPVVAADRNSRPFITSYWSEAPDRKPRFNIVYHDHGNWKVIAGPQAEKDFSLKGTGTKRPPWSRAALFVESDWNNSRVHLIYRDDAHNGRIVAATINELDNPVWRFRYLTSGSVGAWEPSLDPVQATRLRQAHMLRQHVSQLDGNDSDGINAEPQAIGLLIWNPNWERHQALAATPALPPAKNLQQALDAENILSQAHKVAVWQWNHLPEDPYYHPRGWTLAPFYIGNLVIAELLPDSDLEARMLHQAETIGWQPHERLYDADDHCVIQAYLHLYLKYRDKMMLAPSRRRLDTILANPSPASLDWLSPDSRDHWSWSDALFMGPMSWLLMYEAMDDKRYLDFMNKEWWATTERLYRPEIGFYFRDESYLDIREKNGKTIHWSRGTAWSIAGLARVLQHFPKDHPDYSRYLKQYREMSAAFLNAQQADGLWRPGLLDPDTHTARETSGSSFATFALAWGLNNGILDKEIYLPAVRSAWNALNDSVTAEGKLQNVQPVGAAPHGFDPENSEPFAVGAYLLAASEVYKLARND